MNKKVKQLARRSVIAAKLKDNQVKVLEDFQMDAPKTKEFVNVLENLSLSVDKALFVLGASNHNIFLSSRNIPNAKVISVDEINTYDMVHADCVIFFESAVDTLANRLN